MLFISRNKNATSYLTHNIPHVKNNYKNISLDAIDNAVLEESGASDDIVAAARLMEGEGFDPVAAGWDRGMEEEEERVPVEEGEGEFLPVGRKMRKRGGREEEEDFDLGKSEFFYLFLEKKEEKNL